MAPAKNESKVHHFVPRSVLRRFAIGPDQKQIYVFDKAFGSSRKYGLKPTGSDTGYNTLDQPDGTSLNFESDFDELDDDYAKIGAEIHDRRSIAGLDDAFRERLAEVTAVQFLRTPIVRTTLQALPRELMAQMRAKGFPKINDNELPDSNSVRQITRDLIANCGNLRNALLSKDLLLFEPVGNARFWVSDHPVVRHSQMPLGETGFQSLGVEIYLPIASDLMLGFLCPSLRGQSVTGADGNKIRTFAQKDVIKGGVPLKVADGVVNFFNYLQVEHSQRFLYSSADEFDLAQKILQRSPELSLNESFIHMGQLGHAPPRPSNVPPGEWLYLESSLGYILVPINDYQCEGHIHEMSTLRWDLLSEAIAAGSFERACVFAASGRGEKRGVIIQVIEKGLPVRFRLIASDPSLRALDEAISRHTMKP